MKLIVVLLCFIIPFNGISKEDTTANKFYKPLIVSGSIITTGLLLQNSKYSLQNKYGGLTDTRIDDYINYAPMAIMYGTNLAGLPSKNTLFNQTKFLVMAQCLNAGIVLILKHFTGIERPDKSNFYSFPSGHTSMSFVGATTLFNEFKVSSYLLASSGFLFSTATGLLRVTNNKHWMPDVLVGAGIGILATSIIYKLEPLKNWNPFKRKSQTNFSLSPSIDFYNKQFGLTLSL